MMEKSPLGHAKQRSPPGHAKHHSSHSNDLWIDGLLCAYECIHLPPKHKLLLQVEKWGTQQSGPGIMSDAHTRAPEMTEAPDISTEFAAIGESYNIDDSDPVTATIHHVHSHQGSNEDTGSSGDDGSAEAHSRAPKKLRRQWAPIGWARIGELVAYAQRHSSPSHGPQRSDDEWVADQAAPFSQCQIGPTWWCHVLARHPRVVEWLTSAQWLHPAVRSGLRDEGRLIRERMKHLFYEVPVRVAGGLLFELLGHSVGDAHRDEHDVPVVLRSWTSLDFLITAMHVKGPTPSGLNVIGISEVQDAMGASAPSAPQTAHEVVALLADRLARWDDRLFRKHCFGVADEVELKFVSRRRDEDLAVVSIILNQEIRRLSAQVIRVKWALRVREEISYELLAHLRGKNTQDALKRIAACTGAMLEEQEAVCDRLFTVQAVMQSTLHAFLQDTSVRIMHNLAVLASVGLFLTVIVSLFGTNLTGIPGGENSPRAFLFFVVSFAMFGLLLLALGTKLLRFKRRSPSEEQLASRRKELQKLVTKFQISAQGHENLREIPSKVLHRY